MHLTFKRLVFIAAFSCCYQVTLPAQSDYFSRVFFDNSLTPDRYYYSSGKASEPSTLELRANKLPVDTDMFLTPPNALCLHWRSMQGGGWSAEVRLYEWRNRPLYFPGDTLRFAVYTKGALPPSDLPRMVIKDKGGNFSRPLELTPFVRNIPPRRWTQIAIPLSRFVTASTRQLEPHRVNTILFVQGAEDGVEHRLILDEFRIAGKDGAAAVKLPAVLNVRAKGYELHTDVTWAPVANEHLARYVIWRSQDGSPFRPVGIQIPGVERFADFVGQTGQKFAYRVTASDEDYHESNFSQAATTSTRAMSDDELLTMVQEACFRYYWQGADPDSGMTRENSPGDDDIVAMGASGFGIMALVVGVDRGFITREQGLERMRKILGFLEKADRYHGTWPHFLNGHTGRRMPIFGLYDNGADLVETSFLMEGLLTAREYFKGRAPAERATYERITQLWDTVDWDWFRRTKDGDALFWHWSPEYSWHINHKLTGWNEVMITYLLAIASPRHSVPASLYYSGWAGLRREYVDGQTYEGIKLDVGIGSGGPLFFTQYSFMGFDPHVRDRFANYFDNNRDIARINRAYCIRNPGHFAGYGPQCWGITAVDGPGGYVPYEPDPKLDDGTIAPTGAIASFAYTPEASMQALKFFYRKLGGRLWDIYGFRDAFNLEDDWFSRIYMGLNQAPMTVMIENYRTGLVWKNFMANPEIRAMLGRVGFEVDGKRPAR